MAEKQYKNYDERFLKEDTSSGSRLVIEYDVTNSSEIIDKPDGLYVTFKGKFLDGSYCQNANDLKKLFLSGAVFSCVEPNSKRYIMYSPLKLADYSSAMPNAMSIYLTSNGIIFKVVDAPTFEQVKQSQS